MHKVYVAMDESDDSLRGLTLGRHLARQRDAAVGVVSVVASADGIEPRRAALRRRLAAADASDVELDIVHCASAKDYLAELAGQEDASLCLSAQGRRPVPELLIGSVASGVVRRARRPVYVAGPRFDGEAHRRVAVLMVCVDGSRLSEAMLPHAVTLARQFDARLQLLQVIGRQASAPGDVEPGDVMESGYLHRLARRLQDAHQLDVDWDVLHGEPAGAIVDYLAGRRDVLLAMTTHGRSGLSRVAAGSVSQAVVQAVPCPVALLRPADLA